MKRTLQSLEWAGVTLLTLLAPLGCTDAAADMQQAAAMPAVRELIALQTASELAVWQPGREQRVTSDDIRAEVGPSVVSAIHVIRGIPPRDHWHPYLVVTKGDSACVAGGFTSPDLTCVAKWLVKYGAAQGPQDLGKALAIVADENGAMRLVLPRDSQPTTEASTRDAWVKRRPQNWPRDTVFTQANGNTVVRLTVLSQQARSYEQAWRAVAYDFRFDSARRLLAWSRRASEAFSTSP